MDYLIHLAILFAVYSILAMSLNLVVGYTGLFSISHGAFFGIGAYTTAILVTIFETNFFISALAGILAALIISLMVGIVLSKFNDDYFAIVSIGFTVIVYAVFLNWIWLTKGPEGIPGVSKPSLFKYTFSSDVSFLLLILIFFAVFFFICRYIIKTSFGRTLKTIREDEKTIGVYGYNPTHFKLTIFVISAMMAAVAGSFFGSYMSYVGPSMFMLQESIFIVVIIIMGGLGNIYGSILGTLFLILLPEALRFLGLPDSIAAQMQQIIYGTVLVILMIYRPQGFIGEYKM